MKTITLKQTQLSTIQVNCMRAIKQNHGDILTWFIDIDSPCTLRLQSYTLDDIDIKTANELGFIVTLYCDYDVNDNFRTIEAHFFTIQF